MFKKLWHYLINSFLVSTVKNYKKALVLGTDHLAKLVANQSDPTVAAMVTTFGPVLDSFKATDLNLRIALGEYKGETQTVEELFEQLNKILLPNWELQIYLQYPKGTPSATALLPQGRQPFQTGTYESRIQEIEALGAKCALIVALQPLSVIILAFHVQIESARQLQQSTGEGQVATLRTLRETARISLCEAMFGNLGLLMNHYRTNPVEVGNYFDLTLLRKKNDATSTEASIKGTVFKVGTTTGVPNANITVTIAGMAPMVTQTNANGAFEMSLGELTETVNATMDVAAEGFMPYSNSGPVEPGEELEVEVELTPAP